MKSPLTPEQALRMMQRWCAAQDRSQEECRRKLLASGVRGTELAEILSFLINDGFVDEARFARAFVRGKMRIKGWGRQKIQAALRQHQIPDHLINAAIEAELVPDTYAETLDKVAQKKWLTLSALPEQERKLKLLRFLLSKGFSHEESLTAYRRIREQSQ